MKKLLDDYPILHIKQYKGHIVKHSKMKTNIQEKNIAF